MLNPQTQDSGSGAILSDVFGHIIAFREVLGPQQFELGQMLCIIFNG